MRILALDMATITGWATVESSDPWRKITSGVLSYMNGKTRYELPVRLLRFRADLHRMIDEFGAEVLLYEIAHFRGGPATRSGVGMETVLIMTAHERGLYIQGVHSMSLKKFATGRGNSDKSAMILEANKHTTKNITDDNEADAINLVNWGKQYVETTKQGRITTRIQQVKVKCKSTTPKEN